VQDGSWLLGHVRYPCTSYNYKRYAMESLIKWRKRENHMGKILPQKERRKIK
jgi:hypothetical protein